MNENIEITNFVHYPLIGGIYEHYKGGIYEVLTLGKHSETDETLIVYKSILFGSVHIRPLSMWFNLVTQSKKFGDTIVSSQVPRFKLKIK